MQLVARFTQFNKNSDHAFMLVLVHAPGINVALHVTRRWMRSAMAAEEVPGELLPIATQLTKEPRLDRKLLLRWQPTRVCCNLEQKCPFVRVDVKWVRWVACPVRHNCQPLIIRKRRHETMRIAARSDAAAVRFSGEVA